MLIEHLFSLAGKVALVTGANSGFGGGIAGALAKAGAKVVLRARREKEFKENAQYPPTDAGGDRGRLGSYYARQS